MDKSALLVAVAAWQADLGVHPLTCGIDSEHQPLVAVEEGVSVVLRCLDCGYRQRFIPPMVLKAYADRMTLGAAPRDGDA
jgi:hypothetical protein